MAFPLDNICSDFLFLSRMRSILIPILAEWEVKERGSFSQRKNSGKESSQTDDGVSVNVADRPIILNQTIAFP